MSYQALARKYRPQTFSDIVGQETSVQTLKNAIRDQRIHHAYLFAGVRGVGKTTSARILAKALNCASGPTTEPDNTCVICREITEGIDMDVREIDAATYTGVDNVRELRDVTQFQPARDRYRIFIIDEAHMLSAASWNALLKLIEEPPPHVVFMFATTEMAKVPQTIISRVQRQILRKLTLEEIIGRLRDICNAEKIEAEREALDIVARRGEGSVRDALSLLDQVIAFAGRNITAADVATVLGLSETTFFARVLALVGEGDHAGILEALNEAAASGRDFKVLFRDLLNFIRNVLLIAGGANESMLSMSPEDLAVLRDAAQKFSYTELLRSATRLLRDDETINRAEHQRLAVEIALLKAATFPRLRSVEEALSGGQALMPAPSKASKPPARGQARVPDLHGFIERVKKGRAIIGAYLENAKISLEGNVLRIALNDSFAAENVRNAQPLLDDVAHELFGAEAKVEVTSDEKAPEPQNATLPLREDPLVKAFQKHLGAELVEPRKR
jgi:DNA polymerase-3 subunit gamma/tau